MYQNTTQSSHCRLLVDQLAESGSCSLLAMLLDSLKMKTNLVHIAQRTQCVSLRKTDQIMYGNKVSVVRIIQNM